MTLDHLGLDHRHRNLAHRLFRFFLVRLTIRNLRPHLWLARRGRDPALLVLANGFQRLAWSGAR